MEVLLDSRASGGSDLARLDATFHTWGRHALADPYSETSSAWGDWAVAQSVRVVVGKCGGVVRLSAVDIDIVAEGETFEEGWAVFLEEVRRHPDAPCLVFDVGPTRRDEIEGGLDAPEDEDWAKPAPDVGTD
jgi:hypothetical protein